MARTLRANIEDWERRVSPPPGKEEKWAMRMKDTYRVLDLIIIENTETQDENSDFKFFQYAIDNQPIALLVMNKLESNDKLPYVVSVVSHPGYPGIGAKMIEYAVELSKDVGAGGKLELMTMEDSLCFDRYWTLGFTRNPANEDIFLYLDPATKPNDWCSYNGQWRLFETMDANDLASYATDAGGWKF